MTNIRPTDEVENRIIESTHKSHAEHLEMYAAAFMKKTNLEPDQCVLEITWLLDGVRYEFKAKH